MVGQQLGRSVVAGEDSGVADPAQDVPARVIVFRRSDRA
jgi:hypothetical protein